METKMEATLPSDKQMIDTRKGLVCPDCCCPLDYEQVLMEWTNLPAGVKFDPTDVELLDHLAAKCRIGNLKSNGFIDKSSSHFRRKVESVTPILKIYQKDGNSAHYFYKSMNAYASGKRKRRKIQSEDSVRWHKTGKTKPVMENGATKGYKKILVLHNTATNGRKSMQPVKSKWVMHQYHLGTENDEVEGQFVVSKVFYQQKHAKKVDNPIAKEDSVHPVNDISSPNKHLDTNTRCDIGIDIVQTPAQEGEIIKKIPHTSTSGSPSIIENEFPSRSAGQICKSSSTCKEDIISGIAGRTEHEKFWADSPVLSDFSMDVEKFLYSVDGCRLV